MGSERSISGGRGGDSGKIIMETKKAIFDFVYSEKMKSGLIIGTQLLQQLESLRSEEEFSGARKVLIWYLEGLLREVGIAKNVLGLSHFDDLERKVMEITGKLGMSRFDEARLSFSEAISLSTTSCQASMTDLMEKKLI
jgi:hypothetical protein